jgi:AraC-like DNA-binding protein
MARSLPLLQNWHWAPGHAGHKRALLRCGFTRPPDEGREQDFVTTEYALVYLFEGELVFTGPSGQARRVTPGCFFQRLPGRRHQVRYGRGCLCAYLATPAPLRPLFTQVRPEMAAADILRAGRLAYFRRRFDSLLRLANQNVEGRPLVMLAPMLALSAELWSSAETVSPDAAGAKGIRPPGMTPSALSSLDRSVANPGSYDAFMRRAAEELAKLGRENPVAAAAEALGLGYHNFRRRFKKRFGIGPDQFRREALIRRGALLLLDEANRIEAIADALGFPDVHSFSRRFASVMGEPPRRWRTRESGML